MSAVPDLRRLVSGHMPVMDGWRGVAILVVVIHNAGAGVLYGGAALPVALAALALAAGWVGVQLFFVLSGFLITGILLDSLGKPNCFRSFYIRRTLRIFPLYYGFLALALIVFPRVTGPGAWADSVQADGMWYWLYLSNWTPLLSEGVNGLQHLWSLGAEEQFYLVWPTLMFLSGRLFPAIALGIVVAVPAARVGMYAVGLDPDYMYHFTTARADAFAVGALLAIAARRPRWTAIVWRQRRRIFIALSSALAGIVVLSRGFAQYEPPVLLAGQSLISLWFGVLMFTSLGPSTPVEHAAAHALSAQWIRSFGKYSYAIYVLHLPLHVLLRNDMAAVIGEAQPAMQLVLTAVYAAVILGASTVLAYGSWHLYEKRFLSLKDRWAPRPTPAP